MKLVLLFLFCPTLLLAQASLVDRILKADNDGNGSISKDEAPARLKQNFERVDTNKDGKIDPSELKALEAQLQKTRNKAPNNPTRRPPLPDGVTLKQDVAYREGNPKWKLDLYLPSGEAPEKGRPALVVVHGGGWRGGDKVGGNWSRIPAEYAAKGYAAISVNYRLTPEVGMLDCIADVKCAVRWLRENSEEFDINPERIGAYGNSAGAHLVSMLGLTEKADGLEGDGPFQDQSSLVQAVCASATPTDFLNWRKKPVSEFGALKTGEGPIEKRAAKASPVTYVDKDAPPFLLFHAKNDTTVPFGQSTILANKLEEAGVEVTFMQFEDGGHGVFGAKHAETNPAMAAFFEKALKPK